MNIHHASLILIIVFNLASCTNIRHEYPDNWAQMQVVGLNGSCPNLEGIYEERGDAPNGCHVWIEKCRSLSYNLLSGNIGYKEVWDESETPMFPSGSHVEIQQHVDDQIKILLWDVNGNDKHLIHSEILKKQNGDYTCTDEGIQLKKRSMYFLWGISNMLGTETRVFSVNENNELVMHSSLTHSGHHTFFPLFGSDDIWVRFCQ
jgi:hypothetical protein